MKMQAAEPSIELSALLDGEFEEHEARAVVDAALNDNERWQMYALIGDGLRGDCPETPDMTARVMSRLREEPVVLAPGNLQPVRRRHQPLLALAASVAGVAVVGWLALAGNSQLPVSEGRLAAAVPPAPTLVKAPDNVARMPPRLNEQGDMNEYLLAHHAQAATVRLGDSTKQVRTVALSSARP